MQAILFTNQKPIWLLKLPDTLDSFLNSLDAIFDLKSQPVKELSMEYLDTDRELITFDTEEDFAQMHALKNEASFEPPIIFIYINENGNGSMLNKKMDINFPLRVQKFIKQAMPDYYEDTQFNHPYADLIRDVLFSTVKPPSRTAPTEKQDEPAADKKDVFDDIMQSNWKFEKPIEIIPNTNNITDLNKLQKERCKIVADEESGVKGGAAAKEDSRNDKEENNFEFTRILNDQSVEESLYGEFKIEDMKDKVDTDASKLRSKIANIESNLHKEQPKNNEAMKLFEMEFLKAQQQYEESVRQSIMKIFVETKPAQQRIDLSRSINPSLVFNGSECVICKESPIWGALFQGVNDISLISCVNCEDEVCEKYPDEVFKKVKQIKHFEKLLAQLSTVSMRIEPTSLFETSVKVTNEGTRDLDANIVIRTYEDDYLSVKGVQLGRKLKVGESAYLNIVLQFKRNEARLYEVPLLLESNGKVIETNQSFVFVDIIESPKLNDEEVRKLNKIKKELTKMGRQLPDELVEELARNNSFKLNKVLEQVIRL